MSPARLPTTAPGPLGRRRKVAAPGDQELRVGSGGAKDPPHPVCCRSSGPRGSVSPPAPGPAGRTAANWGDQEPPETPERARGGGARPGGGRSILPTASRSSRPGPPRTHGHTLPPHSTWPFVCAHELAHAPSARSRRSRRTRRPGRTRNRRAPVAAGAAWAGARGAGGPPEGQGPEPRRSPARAKGREAARARSASSSRILRGSKDAAEPGVARRGGRRGCCAHKGRGFIAEPRREGAPIDPRDAGSGSSPWRGLPSPLP